MIENEETVAVVDDSIDILKITIQDIAALDVVSQYSILFVAVLAMIVVYIMMRILSMRFKYD